MLLRFLFLLAGLTLALNPSFADSTSTLQTEPEESSMDSVAADTVIVSGSRGFPFAIRQPFAAEITAFQKEWKQALLEYRAGQFADAAGRLRKLQPSEKLAQVYRALFFADVSLAAGSKREADSALEATLHWARGTAWQRQLYTVRLKSFDFKSATRAARKEFCSQALRTRLDPWAKVVLYYQLLALDSGYLSGAERMNAVRQLLSVASPDSRLDSLYKIRLVEFSPGPESWERQKLLFDLEQKLGYAQKAYERAQTMMMLAPGKSQLQALQLNSADLLFRRGFFADAVQSYQKYEEKYGLSPDILLQEARAYRRMSDEVKAKKVYSRLIEAFPRSPKSIDVYWMRAFNAESAGVKDEAVETYSHLITAFPEAQQAPKAAFRIGLAYFKHGDFDSALGAFRGLRRLGSSSRVLHGGLYWEGKTLQAQKDSLAAIQVWADLATRFPFTYYGHAARLNLMNRGIWPDSLNWNNRFPIATAPDLKSWFATLGPGYRDSLDLSSQSVYLPVSLLLEFKMESLALLTLRSQPSSFLVNPASLYATANQLQNAGLWTEAYRFGILLGSLVPFEDWPKAPRAVLRLFYPPAFENAVRKWAAQDGVPPGFVFALIKQESGFDPQAVSRVGARGLMQMMPATGTTQAKHEGIRFTPDDLFIPEVNVQLGTAYLRDLEKRYDGNLYFTLANYNAGPDALNAWMPQLSGRPMDEMVEDISFSETREYVKRVLSNYWTYQALYE